MPVNHPLVDICTIKESSERHVWIQGTLVFIQPQNLIQDKPVIIFHSHEYPSVQKLEFQLRSICVMASVDSIIEAQCRLLVIPKSQLEQTVLVVARYVILHTYPPFSYKIVKIG